MIITASFKTSSSRPIETEKLPYMSIIQSISGVFKTPGLIIAQMTDTLGNVVSKISDDIKTALFNQAIEMLGFGGRIITSFGVKNTIAEALGIKLQNEMTTDITEFSQFLTSEFDNRSQTFGSFSNEKMLFLKRRMETFQVRKFQIVTSLIDAQSYNCLMFKSMSGAGFGTGVFGVVIEEMKHQSFH